MAVSSEFFIFALLSWEKGGTTLRRAISFDLSENLENSFGWCLWQDRKERPMTIFKWKGQRLNAASPVACIYDRVLKNAAYIHNYGCELIFILSFTGIPEPSDEECHEGSHFICVDLIEKKLHLVLFLNYLEYHLHIYYKYLYYEKSNSYYDLILHLFVSHGTGGYQHAHHKGNITQKRVLTSVPHENLSCWWLFECHGRCKSDGSSGKEEHEVWQ